MSDRDQRLNGVMATTRGLGNHGDPALKKCVINEPYTTSVPIDQFAQCLILASDGLWELFSDKEVASLVLQVCEIFGFTIKSQKFRQFISQNDYWEIWTTLDLSLIAFS